MKVSILERTLLVERHRRKMGNELGTFVPPVAAKFPSSEEEGPWVTTLSTGRFIPTRRDKNGDVAHALFECPPEDEDTVLTNLYQALRGLAVKHGWPTLCASVGEALSRMASFGLEPKTLVVPYSSLKSIAGTELTEEEADKVSLSKGCVVEVDGVKVLSARKALPDGTALVMASNVFVGRYTRIYDHVGITILRANTSVLIAGDAVD